MQEKSQQHGVAGCVVLRLSGDCSGGSAIQSAEDSLPVGHDIVLPRRPLLHLAQNILAQTFAYDAGQGRVLACAYHEDWGATMSRMYHDFWGSDGLRPVVVTGERGAGLGGYAQVGLDGYVWVVLGSFAVLVVCGRVVERMAEVTPRCC
jgi:hypothetical protein